MSFGDHLVLVLRLLCPGCLVGRGRGREHSPKKTSLLRRSPAPELLRTLHVGGSQIIE